MANLNDLVTMVCNRLNKNFNDTVVTARIKNWINLTCQEAWDGFDWSFRSREYQLSLVADINSSASNGYTATVNNGSQTVTFSSAILPDTTTHVGAYIRFSADAPLQFYRVLAVPTTSTLTITPAYQGTSGSSKQFFLKKLDWLFPSEAVDVTHIGIPIQYPTLPIFWDVEPPDVNYGIPQAAYIYHPDFIGATYTAGTVSGTVNTNTLTGSGTAWLANVTPGDTITITGDSGAVGPMGTVLTPYTVYKVVSDTSIILNQNLLVAPVGATYTATRQYGRYIRLMPSPNNVWGILLQGKRKYAKLINNIDTNELTYKYQNAIIEGAVWREEGASPDQREGSQYQVQLKAWNDAKADDQSVSRRVGGARLFSRRHPRYS